jgi:hypothetical protein
MIDLRANNDNVELKSSKWFGTNYLSREEYKEILEKDSMDIESSKCLLCQIIDYRERDCAFVEIHCLKDGFWRGLIDCSDIRYPDREDTVGILKVKPYFKGSKGYYVEFQDAKGDQVYLEVPVDNLQR